MKRSLGLSGSACSRGKLPARIAEPETAGAVSPEKEIQQHSLIGASIALNCAQEHGRCFFIIAIACTTQFRVCFPTLYAGHVALVQEVQSKQELAFMLVARDPKHVIRLSTEALPFQTAVMTVRENSKQALCSFIRARSNGIVSIESPQQPSSERKPPSCNSEHISTLRIVSNHSITTLQEASN